MGNVSDLYEGIDRIDEDGYYVIEDGKEEFYKHEDDSDTYALYKMGADVTSGIDDDCTYDGVKFENGKAYAVVITSVATEYVDLYE